MVFFEKLCTAATANNIDSHYRNNCRWRYCCSCFRCSHCRQCGCSHRRCRGVVWVCHVFTIFIHSLVHVFAGVGFYLWCRGCVQVRSSGITRVSEDIHETHFNLLVNYYSLHWRIEIITKQPNKYVGHSMYSGAYRERVCVCVRECVCVCVVRLCACVCTFSTENLCIPSTRF